MLAKWFQAAVILTKTVPEVVCLAAWNRGPFTERMKLLIRLVVL